MKDFDNTHNVKNESIVLLLVEYILDIEKNYKFRGITPLSAQGLSKYKETGNFETNIDDLIIKWKNYISIVAEIGQDSTPLKRLPSGNNLKPVTCNPLPL